MKNVVFALLVVSVCGIGGVRFYLPKLLDERISDRINNATTTFQKQYDQLAEIVKNLESRQQNLESVPSESKVIPNFRVDFERWNCWCNLKNKLLCGANYSVEIAKFREMFSDCPDLLKKVDTIVCSENSETKDDSLINNLLRSVRICSIDKNELDRVSGCVLLLIRKVEENE